MPTFGQTTQRDQFVRWATITAPSNVLRAAAENYVNARNAFLGLRGQTPGLSNLALNNAMSLADRLAALGTAAAGLLQNNALNKASIEGLVNTVLAQIGAVDPAGEWGWVLKAPYSVVNGVFHLPGLPFLVTVPATPAQNGQAAVAAYQINVNLVPQQDGTVKAVATKVSDGSAVTVPGWTS